MGYKSVKFGAVLDQLRRGMGYDPDTVTPTAAERVRDAEILDRMLEVAWQAYLWPQLLIVSKRRYRPDWNAETNYLAGEQVWRESGDFAHYCRAAVNNVGVDPATDLTEATWVADPEEFITNVELTQWWESQEIDGFDLNTCATVHDPLVYLKPGYIQGVELWEQSLLMPPGAPSAVYIRFRPARPRFSSQLWSASTLYATGELAFRASENSCYVALQPSTNQSPENMPTYWAPVGFPEFLVRYCVWSGVAEMQSEDSGKYKTQAKAEAELDRLIEVHGTRSGVTSGVRVQRYRRR